LDRPEQDIGHIAPMAASASLSTAPRACHDVDFIRPRLLQVGPHHGLVAQIELVVLPGIYLRPCQASGFQTPHDRVARGAGWPGHEDLAIGIHRPPPNFGQTYAATDRSGACDWMPTPRCGSPYQSRAPCKARTSKSGHGRSEKNRAVFLVSH